MLTLGSATWLSLVNRTLENMTQTDTGKLLAHWSFPPLTTGKPSINVRQSCARLLKNERSCGQWPQLYWSSQPSQMKFQIREWGYSRPSGPNWANLDQKILSSWPTESWEMMFIVLGWIMSPKEIYWSPHRWYLWVWPYLDIGFCK